MNEREVAQLMLIAATRWPRQWVAPTNNDDLNVMMLCWMDTLGDLDASLVRAVMASWTSEWPPNLGQIRQKALEIVISMVDTSTAPSWGDAWEELVEACHRVGSYGTPTWSHPCVAKAVDIIGYKEFCLSDVNSMTTWRSQFRDIYQVVVKEFQQQSLEHLEAPALASWKQSAVAELKSGSSNVSLSQVSIKELASKLAISQSSER